MHRNSELILNIGIPRAVSRRPAGAVLLFSLFSFLLACPHEGEAVSGILAQDSVWSGEVTVEDDLWVPPGRTLRVLPGTRVHFTSALSTKTEPIFWQANTELAVAGSLEIAGTPEQSVLFDGADGWGGVVAVPGSRVSIDHAVLDGADEALLCVGADCRVQNTRITGAEYGLVLGPGAQPSLERAQILAPRIGILDARGGEGRKQPVTGVTVLNAVDAEVLQLPVEARRFSPLLFSFAQREQVEYLGEYTVDRDQTWRGEVVVAGRVTVTPEAVLTLSPGTRVTFRKHDSNGDGVGEGELLVLGGIRSLGEPERPVVFESAEASSHSGDWDKVSIIASEDPDNHFRYTVFRHGVQALHAHFSRLLVEDCYFEQNLRAVQFQESESTRLERCVFFDNKQALRFRDSMVLVKDSIFLNNLFGVHAFRCRLEFDGNILRGGSLGSFLAKESEVVFTNNVVGMARDGLRMKEAGGLAHISSNVFAGFAEDAISLKETSGKIRGNEVQGAGLDLVSCEDSQLVISGNRLLSPGRHALHLSGALAVDARDNQWGTADPSALIFDGHDDPALGVVVWRPVRESLEWLRLPNSDW